MHTGQDEYNDITLTNDNQPTNGTAYSFNTAEVEQPVAETSQTEETSDSRTHTKGKVVSKAVSNIIMLTGVIVVATATGVAVAAELSEDEPDLPIEITAPLAEISQVETLYYGYDTEVIIQYTLTDSDSEIAEYYLWIEDSTGLTADCTVDSESGTATATVTDLNVENGLTLVVYAYSNLGWYGEIYRNEITLPTAADVTLLDISTDGAFYEGEDSLYYVTFEYYGDTTDITSYSYYFEDVDGNIFPCEGDGEGRAVITFAADTVPTFDTYGQLYFVATALTNSGWEGIIYKEKIVINPPAPSATVSDVAVTYYGYDTDLTLSFTLTDTDGEIADYYLWIEDSMGLTADCAVDSESGTATATVADLDTENGLTLVVYAYSNLGWYGEIYRDEITLPTASTVTLLDISTDGAYYEGEDSLYYITFEYYGDTTDIASYSYYFEDEDGNIFPCEDDGEGRAVITFTADTVPAFDAYGQLYFVATALTNGGWEGIIYRDKIVINPPAPAATVSDVAVTYYGYDTNLTINYNLTDSDGEIADYYLWIEDSTGLTADCTVDSTNGTATATVTDLNVENGLTLVVYAYSNLGWYGEIYRNEITLPTAADVTLLDISTDGAFYEGEDSLYYVTFAYYGDTTDITSYSYYFEDEDGTIFPCEDDGEGRAVITFTADTVPAFDTYGQLYFVATALTNGGWEGIIYKEKIVIATDGYAEMPYVTLVYMPYIDDNGLMYIYPEIIVYDLDGIWTALTLTVTDAGGQEYTVDLINNEDVGYEMDDYDNTIYYVTIEGGSTFTIAEDGTVSVLITATWHEPDGNGGYNDYVTIVYEDAVLLEDTSG
ncbi:MAG: hypothetical protein LUD19_06620 [Clostridia bacterium]|nr:hypothetical protein [Clostridia bacterium]